MDGLPDLSNSGSCVQLSALNILLTACASTASCMAMPGATASTKSISFGERTAECMASRSTSCSAITCGMLRVATRPELLSMPPAMRPWNVSGSSSSTILTPLELLFIGFTTTPPKASALMWPSALASNVHVRPILENIPVAQLWGHQIGATISDAPHATEKLQAVFRPFCSTLSVATYTAVRLEACSVSMVILGPFKPSENEMRLEVMEAAPPVAPHAPPICTSFGA
mmetsp:Transcript_63002/g.150065  ORF Transcript_63002/g.150065 Transcript_63002/m.150065 type:complete len:228 (+) Transcript_63002:748-1431(+)